MATLWASVSKRRPPLIKRSSDRRTFSVTVRSPMPAVRVLGRALGWVSRASGSHRPPENPMFCLATFCRGGGMAANCGGPADSAPVMLRRARDAAGFTVRDLLKSTGCARDRSPGSRPQASRSGYSSGSPAHAKSGSGFEPDLSSGKSDQFCAS